MNIVIIGGSGGIGSALVDALSSQESNAVYATFNKTNENACQNSVKWFPLDVTEEQSLTDFTENLRSHISEIDWLINATGLLHSETQMPEKALKQVKPDFFLQNMAVNALSSLMLAKHLGAFFKHDRPSVFASISAKVGSIEDNKLGGWYSYRCSKAALNMAMKNISIEWTRSHKNVCVAALHPGTTNTSLSEPFQKNVKPEKLFSPQQTADYLLSVLNTLTPEKSGQFWSWDQELLPW